MGVIVVIIVGVFVALTLAVEAIALPYYTLTF
jgi:hypothetical protein